jgi:hypothetical protein
MFLCCNGLILPRLTEIIKGVPGSFEYRPHKCTCTCASGRRCGAGDHGAEGRSGAGCTGTSSTSTTLAFSMEVEAFHAWLYRASKLYD